jgi:hypothetical protein
MQLLKSLKQELEFYLNDLFSYVQELNKVYELLSEKEASQKKLDFLQSFESKMKIGLELILEKKEYFEILEKIRNPKEILLKDNKKRYLEAIIQEKGQLDQILLRELEEKLRKIPLIHATKEKELLKKSGILTAASLWKNRINTSANAMDIALGLHFHYVFFTHGLLLHNFSQDYVSINNSFLETAIVSSVDVYKIVLIKNNLENRGIIPTEKWFVALEDYARQLFSGEDFFELKASYILAYFNGDISAYDKFASLHFYSNDLLNSPPGEYPFLGEIKIFGDVSSEKII